MTNQIPFNRPTLTKVELRYIEECFHAGHASGDGGFTKRCHGYFERELGVKKVLLTTSCTHALEMSALLLNLKPGDEVIFPTFTFVSTVNAFVLRGVQPVFADIRPDTLNLDEEQIESKITARTKAIVPVHYAGVGCEMDTILALAGKHGIRVVEDNAHGLFGRYKGKYLGTMGSMATQSFHETKNFSCGEGGALLINDPALIDRAEIIREKGTNRSQFFRGLVDKYTWVDVGSSFLPSDFLAAILWGQLERRDEIQGHRRAIWNHYWKRLEELAKAHSIGLPFVPGHCEQAYHMFYMVMPSLQMRTDLIAHLKSAGIGAVFHYLPLHSSPMGQRFGGQEGRCPVAEQVSDRLVRLPFFNDMTEGDQDRVVDEISVFLQGQQANSLRRAVSVRPAGTGQGSPTTEGPIIARRARG